MQTLPPPVTLRRARERRDPAFDSLFVFAVKTTGVFCRPTCRAKPAKPQNVEYFPTARDALNHGYRPCKLCKPQDPLRRPPPLVGRLLQLLDHDPARPVRDHDLQSIGIDPSTARRQFRAHFNMTFAAYQRTRRMALALRALQNGDTLTLARTDAGFDSRAGFRHAFNRAFNAPTSASRELTLLTSAQIPTPLGTMLAVAHDGGVVLCDFADRTDLESDLNRLRTRLGTPARPAPGAPGVHPLLATLATQLAEYFAGARTTFTVPLAPQGTDFQLRAWNYLQDIPHAQTRTYAQQARALGRPTAVRAVAQANARNLLCILIPCHRVLGASGHLTGYAGGLARKRWLLRHERSHATPRA